MLVTSSTTTTIPMKIVPTPAPQPIPTVPLMEFAPIPVPTEIVRMSQVRLPKEPKHVIVEVVDLGSDQEDVEEVDLR